MKQLEDQNEMFY